MKYKEFVRWCNERACDGCWSFTVAMACIAIVNEVNSAPFWRRKARWNDLNVNNNIEKRIVKPINELIEKSRSEDI